MCRMEEESIFKQILTYRYNDISSRTTNECGKSSSLVQIYMNLLRKYQLEKVFDQWIKSNMVISKYRWKKIVREKIMDREYAEWQIRLVGSNRLATFKSLVLNIKPCIWWRFIRYDYRNRFHIQTVMKVLCGVYNFNGSECVLCKQYDKNMLEHIICTCNGLSDIRIQFEELLEFYGINVCDNEDGFKACTAILGCEEHWTHYSDDIVKMGLSVCAKYMHDIVTKWEESHSI